MLCILLLCYECCKSISLPGQYSFCSAPHRTAPHRTAPHRTAPHRTAPHRTAPHRTAPHRTAPHRTAPHRTAPHRTAPHRTAPHRTAPHRTAPNRTAPNRTVNSESKIHSREQVSSCASPPAARRSSPSECLPLLTRSWCHLLCPSQTAARSVPGLCPFPSCPSSCPVFRGVPNVSPFYSSPLSASAPVLYLPPNTSASARLVSRPSSAFSLYLVQACPGDHGASALGLGLLPRLHRATTPIEISYLLYPCPSVVWLNERYLFGGVRHGR